MLSDFLKKNITSQAGFIKAKGYGYGQVEPNHLSAQATKEVYAQLPAKKEIQILENGQFAKYDYAKEVVDFDGPGEWLLVWNEIKLYRDNQMDCEFAMIRDNYQARVYSPYDSENAEQPYQARYYNGIDSEKNPIDDVTAAPDMYELHYNENPFVNLGKYHEKMMPEAGSSMVPRLMKTHIGDIFTTNMIADEDVAVEDRLSPRAADGILSKNGDGSIVWQVVKVYTMPDGQPGVKLMRIK